MHKSKDGREVWLSSTYVPITTDDGKTTEIAIFSHDVTSEVAQKKSENANLLRQIEALSATHGRIVYSVVGTILEVNDKCLGMLGYAREALVGQKHANLVHPEFAETDRYVQFLEDVQDGTVRAGNFKRFRKDGSAIWVQAIFCPEYDAGGNIIRVISVKSDVTAVMEASDMTKSISRTQAVIEFSPDGTVRFANSLFLDAMGYTLDEIVGKHHGIFMPDGEATKPEDKEHWNRLQAGDFHTGEYRRREKNGSDIWISASYVPVIGPTGKPVKVIKFATDITPRMRAVNTVKKDWSSWLKVI